jgi:malic enzyme
VAKTVAALKRIAQRAKALAASAAKEAPIQGTALFASGPAFVELAQLVILHITAIKIICFGVGSAAIPLASGITDAT